MDEPDLSGLFEHGPAANDATLRDVVARRERRRVRRLQHVGAGGVVLAVAIAAASLAATRHGPASSDAIGRSAPSKSAANSAAPAPESLEWHAPATTPSAFRGAGSAIAAPVVNCPADTSCGPLSGSRVLFHRTVGSFAITASSTGGTFALPQPQLPATFSCGFGSRLNVTVTTGATSEQLVVATPAPSDAPLATVSTALISGAGAHAALVVLRTSDLTGTVVAHFSDGERDEMRAVDGWAVLVDLGRQQSLTANFGSVTVLAANGRQLASATLQRLPGVAFPDDCFRVPPPARPTTDTTAG